MFSVECRAEKDDVWLQITPCVEHLYKLALRMYRPLCVYDDLISYADHLPLMMNSIKL
jgi:hypothetical protein